MFGFLKQAVDVVANSVQAYAPVVADAAWGAAKAAASGTYYGVTTYGPPVANVAWEVTKAAASGTYYGVTTYGPPVANAAWEVTKAAASGIYYGVTTYGPPVANAAWEVTKVAASGTYYGVTTYGPPVTKVALAASAVVLNAAYEAAEKVTGMVVEGVMTAMHQPPLEHEIEIEWEKTPNSSSDEWLKLDLGLEFDTANAYIDLGENGKNIVVGESYLAVESVCLTGCNWPMIVAAAA